MAGNGLAISGRSAQELLEEFEQTGSQAPFEEIVRRYAGMVYQVCYQVTRNAHDAEDAAQATFLTLAVQRKMCRRVKYVGPWLQHVAYRTSLDMRRSCKRREAREERHGEMVQRSGRLDSLVPQLDIDELRAVLRDELNKLPAKYRLPLILHYFGGLTHDEISRELGCRPKTLGVRLFRGRKMLAQNLAERGVVVGSAVLASVLADAIQSCVAEGFVSTTSNAAAYLAAGSPMSASLVSGEVLTLTRLAGRTLVLSKIKVAIALVLMCASAMSGASEIVKRYAPPQWRIQFDVPHLLNEGGRSLLEGLRGRPLPRLVEATSAPEAIKTPEATEAPPRTTSRIATAERGAGAISIWGHAVAAPNLGQIPAPAVVSPPPALSRGIPNNFSNLPTAITPANLNTTAVPLASTQQRSGRSPVALAMASPGTSSGSGGSASPGILKRDPRAAPSTMVDTPRPPDSGLVVPIGATTQSRHNPVPTGPTPSPPPPPPEPDLGSGEEGIAILRGTHTYTWGDDPAAQPLRRVDAVRFTMRDVRRGGDAVIEMLPLNSDEIPTLPEGHHFIGVWAFETDAVAAGGIDLLVRYDEYLAARRGLHESILKFWTFDDGQWHRIMDRSFDRDTRLNLIGGHAADLQYFAVSAPEPGVGLMLMGAAILALRRRRTPF